MSDTTCLDELFEYGMNGRNEDILRNIYSERGINEEYINNAVKLLDNIERLASCEMNCNLTTCRHNKDGKCTSKSDREECLKVARMVLGE